MYMKGSIPQPPRLGSPVARSPFGIRGPTSRLGSPRLPMPSAGWLSEEDQLTAAAPARQSSIESIERGSSSEATDRDSRVLDPLMPPRRDSKYFKALAASSSIRLSWAPFLVCIACFGLSHWALSSKLTLAVAQRAAADAQLSERLSGRLPAVAPLDRAAIATIATMLQPLARADQLQAAVSKALQAEVREAVERQVGELSQTLAGVVEAAIASRVKALNASIEARLPALTEELHGLHVSFDSERAKLDDELLRIKESIEDGLESLEPFDDAVTAPLSQRQPPPAADPKGQHTAVPPPTVPRLSSEEELSMDDGHLNAHWLLVSDACASATEAADVIGQRLGSANDPASRRVGVVSGSLAQRLGLHEHCPSAVCISRGAPATDVLRDATHFPLDQLPPGPAAALTALHLTEWAAASCNKAHLGIRNEGTEPLELRWVHESGRRVPETMLPVGGELSWLEAALGDDYEVVSPISGKPIRQIRVELGRAIFTVPGTNHRFKYSNHVHVF